jgi:pyridoxal phosphate enzyme (YggS family)
MKNFDIEIKDRVLLDNIKNVYRKIAYASLRVERDPYDVKLVTVTKTVSPEKIKEAINLGLRAFGENRVQEAQEKIEALASKVADSVIEWHMIGHLQKNKAKTAVQLFDLIHSVDSIELARALDKQAEKSDKVQKVLIQVKLSEEETKHGISKEGLMELIETVMDLKHLRLEGLMTIPPFFDKAELTRPFFRQLRELRDNIQTRGYRLPELSMGMTNDFEVAVEEGATIVRVGTAIFGERDYS